MKKIVALLSICAGLCGLAQAAAVPFESLVAAQIEWRNPDCVRTLPKAFWSDETKAAIAANPLGTLQSCVSDASFVPKIITGGIALADDRSGALADLATCALSGYRDRPKVAEDGSLEGKNVCTPDQVVAVNERIALIWQGVLVSRGEARPFVVAGSDPVSPIVLL